MTAEKSLWILVVDDEEIVHQTIAPYLRDSSHQVDKALNGAQAIQAIRENDYDLALVDYQMPDRNGIEVLHEAQKIRPELSVVIMTAHGNLDLAVKALRGGAADFLTKPVKFLELDAVLEKAARLHELRKSQRRLRETIQGMQALEDDRSRGRRLIAESPAMQEVKKQIRMAVEANCETILLSGETGTGKEVAAREIHYQADPELTTPFIAVSCPALPETLIESELFGHVKGSFTGASADKPGCFELADGGSLFLDEVGDLSAGAQAKLLRVLETRKVRRIGGAAETEVKVRVITATNKPLEELVESKKLRPDLYYRLNVFNIQLQPLRERRDDIMPLAEHFLSAFAAHSGLRLEGFAAESAELLANYAYPGNARELKNIVERAAILCRASLIQPVHLNLPAPAAKTSAAIGPDDETGERSLILSALEKTKWNRGQAAKNLGIPYSTFLYKIKKYGINLE